MTSNSTENTLQKGDIILVNKVAYGGRIPNSLLDIPWLNIIPYIFLNQQHIEKLQKLTPGNKRLHPLSSIKHLDIMVINDPSSTGRYMVKRCVGLPGDTLEIRNSDIWVNGKYYRKKKQ